MGYTNNFEGFKLDLDWLMAQVTVTPSGCWEWNGARFGPGKNVGYGLVSTKWIRRVYGEQRAARLAYLLVNGPIPAGLELDHVCRNRPCVRPDPRHLEAVTHAENLRRAPWMQRQLNATVCPQGHPYSGANLRQGADGRRHCRLCGYRSMKRWRERASLNPA